MDVWVILGWEEGYGNWEVLSVLFDATVIEDKVKEIFTEYVHYKHVKVECWRRDYAGSPNASFYGAEDFYDDDDDEVPAILPEDA